MENADFPVCCTGIASSVIRDPGRNAEANGEGQPGVETFSILWFLIHWLALSWTLASSR